MDQVSPILIFFAVCFSPILGTATAILTVKAAATYGEEKNNFWNCNFCSKPLPWKNLIPIFGFVSTRGRCCDCSQPIDTVYFLSEVVALGIVIVITLAIDVANLNEMLIATSLALFLLGLSIYDLTTHRIPDLLTIPFLLMGLAQCYFFNFTLLVDGCLGMIVGAVVTGIVAILYQRITKKIGLGWGDVKLIAGFGAWLGWESLPLLILLSSVSGILFIFLKIIKTGKHKYNDKIPFGPFLCLIGWGLWIFKLTS
jgi:leader peptidase (prepilin peptidase) / N-methyltransferase